MNEGILGESITLDLASTASTRLATVAYHLARNLAETKWQDADGSPKLHLFGQLKHIATQWLRSHLTAEAAPTRRRRTRAPLRRIPPNIAHWPQKHAATTRQPAIWRTNHAA